MNKRAFDWMMNNKKCPVCGKLTMGAKNGRWICEKCQVEQTVPKIVKDDIMQRYADEFEESIQDDIEYLLEMEDD